MLYCDYELGESYTRHIEKDIPLRSGSVVEAITSRGMEHVLITYIDKEKYSGYVLSRQPGILASEVTGIPEELFEEIPDMFGVVIPAADDENFGLYILRDENQIFVYHRDNGQFITKVKKAEDALAIVSHKLIEYADSAEESEWGDWSATRKQGENITSKVNLSFLKKTLGLE